MIRDLETSDFENEIWNQTHMEFYIKLFPQSWTQMYRKPLCGVALQVTMSQCHCAQSKHHDSPQAYSSSSLQLNGHNDAQKSSGNHPRSAEK